LRIRPSSLAFASLTLLHLSAASAVTTRVWRVTSYKDFEEGETDGVLLSSLGEATAGGSATRVDVPAAQVFSSATGPDGRVWLGTGDQPDLYVWDGKAARKVCRLASGQEGVLVGAVAVAPDGTVLAGTLPGARLWTTHGDQCRELAKLDGADQIWSIAIDGARHTAYVATGPAGKLYAVDLATGRNRVFWDSGEKHLLALAPLPDGSLLAGSSEDAILYRVAADGTARALHDFAADEVRAIARDGDTIYVAVNEFEHNRGTPAPPPASGKPHGTKIVLPASPSTPAPPPSPGRDRKGKGAVFRLDPDGRIEQLHALGDGYFSALHVAPGGDLYAASGTNGRVYLIRRDRTLLTAFNLPERQILTLALGGPHPLLGTGDAGALYAIDFAPSRTGRYFSKVFDAGSSARWGNLRWSGAGSIAVETRSGNTAHPDKTWSEWRAPGRGQSGGRIDSPSARYLQFRAGLGRGAVLRDVNVWYQPQNQRARVVEVTVGEDPGSNTAKAARAAGKPRSPVVKVRWKVENPDDDELVFRLFYREEGEQNWKPLGGPEPLTAKEWDWNTETIPDGNYVLEVVASDERANPKDEALEDSLVSAPFLIDNRKPEVADLTVKFPSVSGVARDSFSPIAELAWSIDGGEWFPLAPADRIFDDPTEPFSFKLPEGLAPGAHSVAVRAVDAADNVGLAQTTFRVKR